MILKIVILVVGSVLCSYLAYEVARLNALVITGTSLARSAKAYEQAEGVRSVLVLGDSTAVGVGGESASSVPGRLSRAIDASIENHAVSGAITDDVRGQLKRAERTAYDMIVIQVGANDVLYFRSLEKAEESLRTVLEEARALSPRVVLLTAGRIGDAPFFPFFVRPLMNWRTTALRDRFMRVAQEFDSVYVDLYSRPDPFMSDVKKYYADDLLHLSGEGYGFWFGIVGGYVERKWPEIITADVSKNGS